MRVCSSCGRENPDDRDFCECGEYLRWDPTGVVQAVTPEVLQAAQSAAPPAGQAPPAQPQAPTPAAHPAAQPAAPPAPTGPGNGQGTPLVSGDPLGGTPAAPPPPPPAAPPAPVPAAGSPAPTLQHAPAPAPQPQAPAQPEEPDPAAITLRLPEGEQIRLGETLAMGAEPGSRARVLALVRNQSGIVDNYDLSVRGLPDDWWSIFPSTVYLVPFGTSGTYEQEVEIHLHPPRSPEAEARIWELQVVAESKAYGRAAAAAPLQLGIQPFEEVKTKLEPERASGRRKAQFTVAVNNTANAPVVVALDAEDPDNELDINFEPPTLEVPPGSSGSATMEVRPPRQRWIGRPEEKRIAVHTRTGEEALQAREAAAAPAEPAEPQGLDDEDGGGRGDMAKGVLGRFGATPPRASVGQHGVQVQGPRAAAPRVPSANVGLSKLKLPGSGPAVPSTPLMPNQVAFRHKAWLPWWVAMLIPFLIILAVLLFLLLPKNVGVPEVTGSPSAFEAEKKLTEADLKLAPTTKEKVTTEAPPGTVIGQTPPAGEKAEKDSEVAILVAVGNGRVEVPSVVGKTQADAEKIFRKANLTVGQVNPQPPDPKAKIGSQIPAAKEVVKEGKPIDLFGVKPKGKKGGGKDDEKKDGGGGGGGGAAGGVAALPALAGTPLAEAAQTAADAGLIPEKVPTFSEKPKGDLIGTEPPAGSKLPAGAKVKLLVSAGFPQLAFDDGKNVLLVNGATGKRLGAVAKGSQVELDPTFSFDGTKIAFVSDSRAFLSDREKPDEPPVPLTRESEEFSDLAWAPTVDRNVLAMFRKKGEDQDLCLGQITRDGMRPECIADPKVNLIKTVRWAPDGKSLFALGVKELGTFGMVQYKSKKAFSPKAKDWGKGKFVTDLSQTGKGVIDLAISPDGKRMASVSNIEGDVFQLFLSKPKDFLLTDAKPQGVRACKVAWRSDNRELVVVQADEACQEANGQLARMPVDKPREQRQLGLSGDNPVFQPLTLE